jgi:hypothetical protein
LSKHFKKLYFICLTYTIMAEMENDVTLDEELDEDNFESEDNDNDTSYSELTEEDYYKEVERRKKAEETLVKLKRQAKQQDTS